MESLMLLVRASGLVPLIILTLGGVLIIAFMFALLFAVAYGAFTA